MAQPRRAKKIDDNQNDIVKALRAIPGVEVEVDHDDIFVGYKNGNWWFEIKNTDVVNLKTGKVWPSALTKTERDRLMTWPGHYSVVWNLDQILEQLGIQCKSQ